MRTILAALTFLSLIVAGPALAGGLVVIESNAPGIAPGQVLDGSQPFEVPKGMKVTVISQDGNIIKLTGPYFGVPAPGGAADESGFLAGLSALVAPDGDGSVALGATRELEGADGVPGMPWLIDVSRSGDRCIAPSGAPMLWRPNAVEAAELYLKRFGDDTEAEVDWARDAAEIAWPAEIVLTDGAIYLARLGRSSAMKKLVLHLVPATLATDAHQAVWMAKQRCTGQGPAASPRHGAVTRAQAGGALRDSQGA